MIQQAFEAPGQSERAAEPVGEECGVCSSQPLTSDQESTAEGMETSQPDDTAPPAEHSGEVDPSWKQVGVRVRTCWTLHGNRADAVLDETAVIVALLPEGAVRLRWAHSDELFERPRGWYALAPCAAKV